MTVFWPKQFPWGDYGRAMVFLALFAILPLIASGAAQLVAALWGCPSISLEAACMVLGSDWAPALNLLSILAWFARITLPLALGALLVSLVILFTHRLAWQQGLKAHSS